MIQIRKFIRSWKNRPFPRNLDGFKCAMVSDSQLGEDLMAEDLKNLYSRLIRCFTSNPWQGSRDGSR